MIFIDGTTRRRYCRSRCGLRLLLNLRSERLLLLRLLCNGLRLLPLLRRGLLLVRRQLRVL